VDVIVVRSPLLSEREAAEAANNVNKGIKVHNIWYNGFPFWVFRVRNKIKEIEKEGEIDIFDIHSIYDVFIFLFQRRTILYSLHFFELSCPGPQPNRTPRPCLPSFRKCWRCCGVRNYFLWRSVRWLATKKVTRFMVKYEYMKRLAVESGIAEDKIEVVPFWLDVDRFWERANNTGFRMNVIDEGDKLIVHVGRLSPENGVLELLKAFTILGKKISNAKLVLVGDGILKKHMDAFCSENHIENKVVFVGAVQREDVFKYLSIADCAVSCQLTHNYNWALLEYMCAQKPIVATNVGGTSEILTDGYSAILAEPTPESLSSKMQLMLENPQLGKKLAQNALTIVKEKHTLENLKKYEELVHRLKE